MKNERLSKLEVKVQEAPHYDLSVATIDTLFNGFKVILTNRLTTLFGRPTQKLNTLFQMKMTYSLENGLAASVISIIFDSSPFLLERTR